MRSRFKTRAGNVTSFVIIIYRRFRIILTREDQTCGLTFDDITFILMLFADDMVILGKDKFKGRFADKCRPFRNVLS